MSEECITIQGILNPDGTLKLDHPPTRPAGPVEVTIRALAKPAKVEDWLEVLQRSRAELEAAGHRFRTKEEIDADPADIRDWDGKVEEVARPLEGYGPYLERVRARREAEGFPFRTKEEIDAEMDDLRSWDDRPEGILGSAVDETGAEAH